MPTPISTKTKKILVVIVVIAVLGALAAASLALQQKDDATSLTDNVDSSTVATSTDEVATSDSTDASSSTNDQAETSTTYNDGSYTTTQRYATPGGSESISVTITVSGDVITSTTMTASESDSRAANFQAAFMSAYKTQVVGKSLDGLSLSRLAGASLTTRAFNTALETIRDDAAA